MGHHFRHMAEMAEDEGYERTMSDRALLARILGCVMVYRRRFLVTVALVVASAVIGIVMPYIWKVAIDGYIIPFGDGLLDGEALMRGLAWLGAAYILLTVGSYAVETLKRYLLEYIGQSVMRDLRNRMFAHLQEMSQKFYDNSEIGLLMSKVISDVETMSEVLATGLVNVFSDVLILGGIIIVMLLMDVKLTLLSLVTIPILLGMAAIFRSRARKAYRMTRKKIAGVMSNLQESISGIRVAQSFSREKENAQHFDQVNVENLQANVYAAQVFSMFFPAVELIGAVGIAIVLYFGGLQVADQGLKLGTLFLFQMYVTRFFHPIMDLTMFYNSIQSAFAGSERVFGLLDTPPEVVESEAAEDLGRSRGQIDFENVEFSYVPRVKVLEGFDLHVRSGERLAIVGPTGAGKSTVMNALLRFYDVKGGAVKVDGKDVRNLTLESLRANMAIVLQDTFLFSGTIRDNIKFSKPEATDEEMVEAARTVGADEFISRLPLGYDTEVTERGGNLSVGQRQLISFARALLADPPILLLDEATSSVDPYTELVIQGALEELLKNRTSIVIAHRLSTVRNADRIVVMDRGKIVEEGSHSELQAAGGMYAKLCQMQFLGSGAPPNKS